MNTKYFKVLKDNFLWQIGAIIKKVCIDGQEEYIAIKPIFVKSESMRMELVSCEIVENNPDYFTEVYAVEVEGEIKFTDKETALKMAIAELIVTDK